MVYFLFVLLFVLSSCGQSVEVETKKDFTQTVSVAACGDVLIYDDNYRHFTQNGSVEDFFAMVEPVCSSIRAVDVAICNQEAMTGGRTLGLSGYPYFNAPFELVEALRRGGFDIFATANNHSLDRGQKGIDAAVDYYCKNGVLFHGTASQGKDPLSPLYFVVKDITFGLLSLTDITNIQFPQPSPVAHTKNRVRLREVLQEASQRCDFVIVLLHYGEEYLLEPLEIHRELFQFLIDNGADLIYGNHAHVIQPFEIFPSPKGEAYVFWGLGNFIGWMKHLPQCSVGGIFQVLFTVEEKDGKRLRWMHSPSVELTHSINRNREHKTVYLRDEKSLKPLFQEVEKHIKSRESEIIVF